MFHLPVEPDDRVRYIDHLSQFVKPCGNVSIATFALDEPERCSGLPVRRCAPQTLSDEIGAGFELAEMIDERHRPPSSTEQFFCHSRFVRVAE